MAKKYLTKQTAPAYALPLFTNTGENTGFKLAIPYNLNEKFSIGQIDFEIFGTGYFNKGKSYVRAMQAIPPSWLIDLNAD